MEARERSAASSSGAPGRRAALPPTGPGRRRCASYVREAGSQTSPRRVEQHARMRSQILLSLTKILRRLEVPLTRGRRGRGLPAVRVDQRVLERATAEERPTAPILDPTCMPRMRPFSPRFVAARSGRRGPLIGAFRDVDPTPAEPGPRSCSAELRRASRPWPRHSRRSRRAGRRRLHPHEHRESSRSSRSRSRAIQSEAEGSRPLSASSSCPARRRGTIGEARRESEDFDPAFRALRSAPAGRAASESASVPRPADSGP